MSAFEAEEANKSGDFFKIAIESKDPDAQESDLMELIRAKDVPTDVSTDAIQLVSLGCSCSPKLSFKGMGRGAETLPFDWVRTTLRGVHQLMTSNFKDFFDFTTRQVVHLEEGASMTIIRAEEHSFWHDDPTSASMRERYLRRIDRFNAIDAHKKGVLFVRGAATSDEVADASIIINDLQLRFGVHAAFLLVIDFQGPTAVVLGMCWDWRHAHAGVGIGMPALVKGSLRAP